MGRYSACRDMRDLRARSREGQRLQRTTVDNRLRHHLDSGAPFVACAKFASMRGLSPLLLLAAAVVVAAGDFRHLASGSVTSAYGSFASQLELDRHMCRGLTRAEFAADATTQAELPNLDVNNLDSEDFVQYTDFRCHKVCPIFGHGNLQCSAEEHHAVTFDGYSTNLMFSIAFLSFGARVRACCAPSPTLDPCIVSLA